MAFPPKDKSLEGLLKDHDFRIGSVERRLGRGSSSGNAKPAYDSGWVDLIPLVTFGTGWSYVADGGTSPGIKARRVGATVHIFIQNARVAAGTVSVPTNGNIANSTIFTGLPAEFRPAPGTTAALASASAGPTASASIYPSGSLALTALVPDSTLTASTALAQTDFSWAGSYMADGTKPSGSDPITFNELPGRLGGPDGDLLTIAAGVDLNSITTTGWFIQRLSAEATLALNYPVARAGHLTVSASMAGSDYILQTYTEYAPPGAPSVLAREWRRTHYNGTWTVWSEVSSDTGWIGLTPINSFTSRAAPDDVSYRIVNGIVYLSGHFIRPTAPGTAGVIAATLPAGARPKTSFHARGYDAWDVTFEIQAGLGSIIVMTATVRSSSTAFGYSLGGISFPAWN